MAGLLAGVRVLDLTTVLAGPFAGYQLGLLGADVIKIENPRGGDLARDMGEDRDLAGAGLGAPFLAQNADKRSVTLDLKNEDGRRVFTRLLAWADVLVENMRPGALSRLGYSPEAIAEINPRLVYCAVSGFGATGPLAGRAAYDQIIQGLAGMADITGRPEDGPLRVGFPVCDTLGGYVAALAVCAALVRREREGVGAYLDVSMLESALTAMGWATSEHLISGRPGSRHGNDNAASSPSGSFRASDRLLNIAANTQRQFESLCLACGRPDLLDDPRFVTRELRKRHRAELTVELEVTLKTRTAHEWEEVLAERDVPAAPVLTLEEALSQEQVADRGLVHSTPLDAPGRTSASVFGSAIHVDGRPLGPAGPAPRLGEHTDAVLAEAGFSDEEISLLRASGAL